MLGYCDGLTVESNLYTLTSTGTRSMVQLLDTQVTAVSAEAPRFPVGASLPITMRTSAAATFAHDLVETRATKMTQARTYAKGVDQHFDVGHGAFFNGDLAFGAGVFSDGAGTTLNLQSGTALRLQVNPAGSLIPGADNTQDVGSSSFRMRVFYAGTGTINTSDARQKSLRDDGIDPAVLRAWANVKFEQFRFRDAEAIKGPDGARWHFGVVAQQVKAAFEAEGLDAFSFGLLCYDEWGATPEVVDAETGRVIQPAREAGNSYGIRYDEALILECAYLRSRLP